MDGTVGTVTASPATESSIGQKLMENLAKIADNIVTLRVTTAIATVTASKLTDIGTSTEVNVDGEAKEVASTTINMLLGDCTTVYSEGFLTNKDLAQLHKDALADARTIRADTVSMITKALESLKDMVK